MTGLTWLPEAPDWTGALAALPAGSARWDGLRALADTRMDFLRTIQLDRRLRQLASSDGPEPIRLAIFGSSTVDQLLPGIRVAALRRGLRLEVKVAEFGQYRQDLLDPSSAMAAFRPQAALFAIDAREAVGVDYLGDEDAAAQVARRVDGLAELWGVAQDRFGAQVLQQTLLPVMAPIMGGAEHRAPGSPLAMVAATNRALRARAATDGVDIVALDERAARDGLHAWYSDALWHRAKQEISPAAGPMYGELVARVIAARRGGSAKCLVLDLDNTLWGGVIGDDGLAGIVLGQGHAGGEAFVEFQRYCKALAGRGVILAVCSKNDEANALEAFERHPDMILRRQDIGAFVANWDDKATNLRRIAADLNIGVDALVFADDNPFERNIVRQELPRVAVPELPDDPALYAATIADAGYFEALEVTPEDRARGASYQARRAMVEARASTSDVAGYLATLDMRLIWGRIDALSLKRVAQLANKTNQFNLTTRRYTEAEMQALADDPDAAVLHFRLVDRYADHGVIAVVILRRAAPAAMEVETWLMSCRVLGRGVERATLAIVAAVAEAAGATRLTGRYLPTAKNAMVRGHYGTLGFVRTDDGDEQAPSTWALELPHAIEVEPIAIEETT